MSCGLSIPPRDVPDPTPANAQPHTHTSATLADCRGDYEAAQRARGTGDAR